MIAAVLFVDMNCHFYRHQLKKRHYVFGMPSGESPIQIGVYVNGQVKLPTPATLNYRLSHHIY